MCKLIRCVQFKSAEYDKLIAEGYKMTRLEKNGIATLEKIETH